MPSFSKRLDVAIFISVVVVLLALLALLTSNLAFQYFNYRDGIEFALADSKLVDHASIITYSRAWDFAVVKTTALFMSFLLIFTGALYVLRASESNFQVSAENSDFKGSLTVSSPGLAMIVLGVALCIFVLANRTHVEYTQPSVTPKPQKEWIENPTFIEPSNLMGSVDARESDERPCP